MNTSDLLFRVADVLFRTTFTDIADARPFLPSYAPFYVDANPEEANESLLFHLTIGQGQADLSPEGEEVGQFDCGGINHSIHRIADGYKIIVSDINGDPACALLAQHRFAVCRATLFGTTSQQTFGLNNALMIAFAFAGAHSGILLMHSSVTFNAGKAYLFLGKSGTGKSTHSALWRTYIPGSDLLNDDNPAIRTDHEGKIIVYGTPWSGKTPCYRNLSFPVGAVVSLEQAPHNRIRREPPVKAFATILSSCSTMIWDKPSYDAILSSASRFAATCPVFHLQCLPDQEAAVVCHRAISKTDNEDNV